MTGKKGKRATKCFRIALILIVVIIGVGISGSNKEDKTEDSSLPKTGIELQSDADETDVDTPDKIEGSTSDITDLLNNYNAIAEYPITSDMVNSGARTYDNWVSVNGVSVHITSTEKAIAVDYDLEGPDDSAIVPIMRDFCKALAPSLTDKDFDIALEELRSGKYEYYDRYTFNGIEVMYSTTDLISTENIRYTIKTHYDLGK